MKQRDFIGLIDITRRFARFSSALILLTASGSSALAQKKYDPGVTDTEIKIGNIMPYSGPLSAYSVIGRTEAAYFRKINAEGGINGRRINFITYDDAEQARKLVESDEVLLIFGPLGTASNAAIQKYVNAKKVPQLFVQSGATRWNDPLNFPVDYRLGAQLSKRSTNLRKVYFEGKAERKNCYPLPERRWWERLSQGPKGWPRRQGCVDDRRRRRL